MTHRLQVLISADLNERLATAAARERVSKGEWVRQALEMALSKGATGTQNSLDPVAALSQLQAPTDDLPCMLKQIEQGRDDV